MSKTKIGSTYYLAIGLILFPAGMLMLFRQPTIINLISNIMPSITTVEIFGLILQFLGEGLICFGIIGAISGKVIANTDYNRQVLVASATRNTQEQTALFATFKKSIDEQVSQLHVKLNQIQAQRTSASMFHAPSKCRFCGAKIEQGSFCPSCGKAN
jgi:hypothetical protein